MSEQATCMQCGGPLEPCTCRAGCPGGQCVDGCYLTTDDAVECARTWLAQNQAEKGGPVETLAAGRDIRMLARAVIEQAAEIEKLKAALGEALDIADMPPKRWNDDIHPARIDALRRLL